MAGRNPHSVACKRLLRLSIAHSGLQQKVVAIDCGVDQGTFSRYLSDEHEHQLPLDLIPLFVASTGDDRILRYLQSRVRVSKRTVLKRSA